LNQRKSFTKFRISNHKLKIETGRYSKPLENRIREKCFSDEIESEENDSAFIGKNLDQLTSNGK
jgi:hypothetical protein